MKHHSSSSSELTNDPWGQSLTWLMRYFEVRHHTKKVLSGLPLVEGRLDSDLFIRAAERADLELTLIDLKSTAMLSFPLVVINRKTLQPAIISERHNSDYQVTLFSEDQGETQYVTSEELHNQFQPQAWQVSMRPELDKRISSIQADYNEHWLFAVVKEMSPWYRDLLIAYCVKQGELSLIPRVSTSITSFLRYFFLKLWG
ncbi:hypothetical protein NB569_21400 [Vibrio alginolyticus]|nr:hypothetical protein [Vibrio alginolyticus]